MRPAAPIPSLSPLERSRFMERVDVRGPEECWPWRGSKNRQGYGVIRLAGKQRRAPRIALALDGRCPGEWGCACHTCDNPSCVNPRHLYVGSPADNMRDRTLRKRAVAPKGETNGHAKLTAGAVQIIRASPGPLRVMADRFGVSIQTICDVRKGRKWKHVPEVNPHLTDAELVGLSKGHRQFNRENRRVGGSR